MRPVFDYEQLNALLRDFYELSRIRITVFDGDFCELTSVPCAHAPLCRLIRSTEAGAAACRACDLRACAQATRDAGPRTYVCHAGLTEAIMPFYVRQTLAGYLILGQALVYPSREQAQRAVAQRCCDLPLEPGRILSACAEMPLVSSDYFRSATHILHAIASYLTLEKVATLKAERVAERLDRYLSAHFAEPITARELCEQLGVGKTQLYGLSKQLYGMGVAQRVRQLRIERARRLLLERPEMSVGEVAEACGFTDYNYFIAVFSKLAGEPPSRYRRRTPQPEPPDAP